MEIELDFIVETLQNKTGLDLKKPTRKRQYVLVRSLYYKLAREYTVHSLAKIGEMFNKDHATVLHGLKVFDTVKMYEPKLYDLYNNFKLRYPVELFNTVDDIPAPEELSSIIERIGNMDKMIKERDQEIRRLNIEIDLMKHRGEDKRSDIVKLISEVPDEQMQVFTDRISAMVKMMNTTV
jgi:hypothetical protein